MRLVFAFITLFLFISPGFGQNDDNPVIWSHEVNELTENDYELIFKAKIADGWHIFSQFTDENGSLPSEFTFLKSGKDYELVGIASESETVTEYSDIFEAYQNIVKEQADSRSFRRNRSAMEALVTNLLELLCWLSECRVSIRDLKPDNLLVVGDKNQFPRFLQSPEEFIIGFIDLETATYCPKQNGGTFHQPPLGGTPPYATPSHFVANDLLAKLYVDVWKILHFQDWYAVLTIIFEVITGQRLFHKTAGQIQNTVKSLQLSYIKQQPVDEIYRSANSQFWDRASREFFEKLNDHSKKLESLNAFVPDLLIGIFSDFLKKEEQESGQKIRHDLINVARISVKDLMELMFQDVKKAMALDDFCKDAEPIKEKLIETDAATMNFTHTIQA